MECIAGAGARRSITANAGNALSQLQLFLDDKHSWVFGHLSYDLKNEIEAVSSSNRDQVGFPDLHFFEPEICIRFSPQGIFIEADDPHAVFKEIEAVVVSKRETGKPALVIHSRFTREEYLDTVRRLQNHILRGDCYEINFCQEFFANADIIPLQAYWQLSQKSPNPFSLLYRQERHWLICASPERFLKKTGDHVLSQPIKGTAIRNVQDTNLDALNKKNLLESEKDRSENVMVVDLVRNDLAKVCVEGSVEVDELYGIYSFPQVHQMISTVSGRLDQEKTFTDIIRATFPMGSMTGAPKKRVMELIDKYERSKRGIFSGAAGYITPSGDFDFNVVIRSIMYNETTRYLSFQAGSAITFYSKPEDEWDECLLKAEAIRDVLKNQ